MVVKAVLSNEANYSWYGEIIEELKAKLRGRPNYQILFVRREGNGIAHSLAKLGLSLLPKNV